MNVVTIADFVRNFGHYHDEAKVEPVVLTKHGRPSVVLMSIDRYEQLTGHTDPRRVYGRTEMPEDLTTSLLDQLDADRKERHDSGEE